ncbi:hypothetical protein D9757_005480 [Collybiopsis confluens]|uniref:DUF221-domain-containing protein n=1 Tax=Collybiopsis confluens TaxID=2823264 RepID=A0A8H5HLS9_9AGAR|nr:hypothetical protein D9757_005480 [Collybiopsis confluens]
MGDIQTRPFSKDYSGLINQSVIGIAITVICVGGQELMKRARRGKKYRQDLLASRESWEFGYLYQGRSWARYPSPPIPLHWPIQWIPQVIGFSEERLNQLRGVDAALYVRFIRGCFWFALLHTLTTFLILFPIHVEFSGSISPKSMTRASISSLVGTSTGLSLLWIHICLLFWITLSWIATLFWIMHGAFRLRFDNILAATKRLASTDRNSHKYHPHPHPPYNFTEVQSLDAPEPIEGLRLRTIMVSNVPPQLRNENELKEYFEYFMSRKLEKPALGLNSTTQPGMFNKMFSFLFNRVRKIPAHIPALEDKSHPSDAPSNPDDKPEIERVVIARKMTELASLLERREDILRLLETAHIKLAKNALKAVKVAMDREAAHKPFSRSNSRAGLIAKQRAQPDLEGGDASQDGTITEEQRMERLIKTLGSYVDEFGLKSTSIFTGRAPSRHQKYSFRESRSEGSQDSDSEFTELPTSPKYPPSASTEHPRRHKKTIWDALLSLPRNVLDPYQPLVRLSHLFRGKTVPSIDYYTAKLNLLSSLITENRAKPANRYDPVSTAFVTFADPEDARRACKYLAVHPNNPLMCLVTMAPQYQDLDWHRVMKSSFNAEFVKDWVVNVGVWGFTIFWIFPVTLLVGLVSIQSISTFWPRLRVYLDKHPWEEEVIQSFLPTLLVALLALLIPLILLLIGKKAHTITTLSALHDRIMTRYYKFLIVNVLVFFCVGTAALQSILDSIGGSSATTVLNIVATSFPTAGPFYVGWLIFTTAMHGGFEIALCEAYLLLSLLLTGANFFVVGLPLIMYPSTKRQVTPRRRAIGVRPRTFNYYYWLPTHLLVIHVLMLFSVLNPVVIPFGLFYFFIESGVVKNQLIHVYAKNYEGNGKLIMIRVVRYSLDGLILSQFVFLAYMVVLKKSVNVGLSAFLIVFTTFVKIFMTRVCRARFEEDDIREAKIMCHTTFSNDDVATHLGGPEGQTGRASDVLPGAIEQGDLIQETPPPPTASKLSLHIPAWVSSSYATIRQRPRNIAQRPPIPFAEKRPSLSRLTSLQTTAVDSTKTKEADDITFTSLATVAQENFGPVTLHPPPISWDDQSNFDLPYDNPYYTRAISNILWLPRDPCGTLDLDDTCDLKVAIAVDPAAGQLGTWIGVSGETRSPTDIYELALDSSKLSSPPPFSSSFNRGAPSILSRSTSGGDYNDVWSYTSEPEEIVDGTEEIDLPEILVRRAQQKDDVERAARPRRPSTFRDKSSSRSLGGSYRRAGVSRPPPMGASPDLRGTLRSRKQSSILSALEDRRQKDGGGDPAMRPDAHAQAELVMALPTPSRLSVDQGGPSALKRSTNISANRAIYHEVLAEEKHELQQRLEEEQAVADKTQSTKSWLTNWMFTKAE